MKRIIDECAQGRLSLRELSLRIGCSESHAARLFRREFAVSPHRYHADMKLGLARTLLTTTDIKVREVAERLSFSDEFYFSACFRKAFGQSPRAFRRSFAGTPSPLVGLPGEGHLALAPPDPHPVVSGT